MGAIADYITARGVIVAVADTSDTLREASRIPGAKRIGPLAWTFPPSLDTCERLQGQGVDFSPALSAFAADRAKRRRYVEAMKTRPEVDPLKPVPIRAPYKLYQHQVRAYNIGLALRNAALLMDMGTGKTLTTIMIAGRRYLDGRIRRVLIVSPASVCNVWKTEFPKFGDFPSRVALLLGDHDKRVRALRWLTAPVLGGQPEPLRVAVINYESAWRLKDHTGKIDYLREYDADMIVCDESQRIKSHTAKQSKSLWELGDRARYKVILSGTPIQKDTRDLWSQYRFLDPTVFPMNYYCFQRRYALLGGFNNRQFIAPRNMDELTRKAHGIAYRVTKEECLDLPEKTFEDRLVPLDAKSMKLYRQLQRDSIAELDALGGKGAAEVTANHVLTRMLRLQQLTGGFLKDDNGDNRQINTVKLDALSDIVESLCIDEGRKLVVFTRFLAEMDAIQQRVEAQFAKEVETAGKRERLSLVRIDGGVKSQLRGGLVERFQTDPCCRVFLGELDACAEGLTLTASSTCVYYSVNWNYAKYDQSVSRIHRISQTGTCTYIHMIAPGTIDARIMRALHAKENLAKSVVDNWRDVLTADEE